MIIMVGYLSNILVDFFKTLCYNSLYILIKELSRVPLLITKYQ